MRISHNDFFSRLHFLSISRMIIVHVFVNKILYSVSAYSICDAKVIKIIGLMGILMKKISFSQKKTLILHLIKDVLHALFTIYILITDYDIRKQ